MRNLVEPAIARWAAERDLQRSAQIESALNEMIANNQDREAFNEADIRYHEAVLQSVRNPVLQQLSIAIVRCSGRFLNEPGWAMRPTCRSRNARRFDAIKASGRRCGRAGGAPRSPARQRVKKSRDSSPSQLTGDRPICARFSGRPLPGQQAIRRASRA